MIRLFGSKETQKVFFRERSRKLPENIQKTALRKLRMLRNSSSLNDLKEPPANSLERLKGARAGRLSIRINDKWRICFRWDRGDAFEVEIVDYH